MNGLITVDVPTGLLRLTWPLPWSASCYSQYECVASSVEHGEMTTAAYISQRNTSRRFGSAIAPVAGEALYSHVSRSPIQNENLN